MVNSGSSANLLAVSAVSHRGARRPGPGDEVIVPAVTWSDDGRSAAPVRAVPVFVDIDPDTLNLRPDDLEEAISPRTRAIFAVHLLGNPADMHAGRRARPAARLRVLEDTCESLGSSIDGRKVGSFGDLGTFTSSSRTTSRRSRADAGHRRRRARGPRALDACARLDPRMSNRAELEAANPWIDPRFLFVHAGYNLRPTELQAAFGLCSSSGWTSSMSAAAAQR